MREEHRHRGKNRKNCFTHKRSPDMQPRLVGQLIAKLGASRIGSGLGGFGLGGSGFGGGRPGGGNGGRNGGGIACGSIGKLSPNVFEGLRAHRGVFDRVGDRGVAEEVLQSPCVHTLACQGVAGRVPQHVNMNRERQLSGLARSLDHPRDSHAAERLAALVHKHIGRLDGLVPL